MNIESYKYLWDGSEPEWILQYHDHIVWHIEFNFEGSGPNKNQIIQMHKIIPELHKEPLPVVYKILKGKHIYRTKEHYQNIEIKELERLCSELDFNFTTESKQIGGYLPISKDNYALLIEDEQIEKQVIKKMLESGVKVEIIHVD